MYIWTSRNKTKVCSAENFTKHSSNELLCLVRFSAEQTLRFKFKYKALTQFLRGQEKIVNCISCLIRNWESCIYVIFNWKMFGHIKPGYSCNKVTMTWIQISLWNWNGFSSNTSHQIIPIDSRKKSPKKLEIGFNLWILTNNDEVCIPHHSRIFLTVSHCLIILFL